MTFQLINRKNRDLWEVDLKRQVNFVTPDKTFFTFLNHISTRYSIMGNRTYLARILSKSWFQFLYFDVFCIPQWHKMLKRQLFEHYEH